MADKTITIPTNGEPVEEHVKNGDRVSWQSARSCAVSFTNTPFRQTGGPQSISVPGGGSSPFLVVAGPAATYPYSVGFGATASDPDLIVDP